MITYIVVKIPLEETYNDLRFVTPYFEKSIKDALRASCKNLTHKDVMRARVYMEEVEE